MREFLHRFLSGVLEVFRPAPFVDEDPQSTAEATAVRTQWIAERKHPAECAGGCRCERR